MVKLSNKELDYCLWELNKSLSNYFIVNKDSTCEPELGESLVLVHYPMFKHLDHLKIGISRTLGALTNIMPRPLFAKFGHYIFYTVETTPGKP